ncbi:myelin protein zero-like protein 2b [Erpetoichthys calabaricus]|uniref:Myelin protein zero like 2 n=1 Tax=Erpetoichthys calabaricus TaxID=27687 RepID=A0A8C4XBN9_ERPCA|nr:myelin protein zero-like protein 2b [Erpetoichthys calabaricus]
MGGFRLQFTVLVLTVVVSGVTQTLAMEIYTQEDMEAVNGTDVRLKCTFKSKNEIKPTLIVNWNFRPQAGGAEITIMFYQGEAYPATDGPFKGRVMWSGNIDRMDASINLRDVQWSDNGTFICMVKNPPDVHGTAGLVHLKVVSKASVSEIAILAAAIGGATLLVILFIIISVSVKFCLKKRHREGEPPMQYCTEKEELKDSGSLPKESSLQGEPLAPEKGVI